jgi:hypothetical protein
MYFAAISYILCHFRIFMVICYIFPNFGTLYQEKSGNPEAEPLFSSLRPPEQREFDHLI